VYPRSKKCGQLQVSFTYFLIGQIARPKPPSFYSFDTSISSSIHVAPRKAGAAVRKNLSQLREEVVDMFDHAFNGYMRYAFPMDDLHPISCTGSNSQGGMALTLLDSLDTLYLLNRREELRKSVLFISKSLDFDMDARVHVFEVNIRAVGGLLSGHVLLSRDKMNIVPWYKDQLLVKAQELADRLLPAFDTPTGVPLSWINLKTGQVRGDTRVTCTACAGTLLLEFGVLSRLTNNPIYEEKAKKAVLLLFNKRSVRGLLGTTFNVDKGEWVRRHSSIGAGVDSFYEYLLKAYLSFGEKQYLDMFVDLYSSTQAQMALSEAINGLVWPVDVHMTSGRIINGHISALSAFWPGLQALAGQFEDASKLFSCWDMVRRKFKWIPESFSPDLTAAHPVLRYYPLRPEYIESGYLLYSDTNDSQYMESIASFHETLRNSTRARCGFASISNVQSGQQEDSMESFFLSETTKYLYLAFSKSSGVLDNYILSTEAHFFPSFPSEDDDLVLHDDSMTAMELPQQCMVVCSKTRQEAKRHLNILPSQDKDAPHRILRRRCAVCKALGTAMEEKREEAMLRWRAGAHNPKKAGSATVAPPQLALKDSGEDVNSRYFLCILQHMSNNNKMDCLYLTEIVVGDMTSQGFQALPPNSVILDLKGVRRQEIDSLAKDMVEIQVGDGQIKMSIPGVLAIFGDSFFPGCLNESTYEDFKHQWTREMNAQFLDDTEEELLYKHEVELTNEQILDRIQKQAIVDAQRKNSTKSFSNETIPCEGCEEKRKSKESTDVTFSDAASMPVVPSCDTSGRLVMAEPLDGCSPPTNIGDLKDSIVIMKRGGCSFHDKALQAQFAGARALIVINDNGHSFRMDGSKKRNVITIPCMMIGSESSETLLRLVNQTAKVWSPDETSRVNLAMQSAYGLPSSYNVHSYACPVPPTDFEKNTCDWNSLVHEYQSSNVMQMDMIAPNNWATQNFMLRAFHEQKADFSPMYLKLQEALTKN